jgi:hypothetical protein
MEKPVALEHLDTPDDNESQERALITKVAETLPSFGEKRRAVHGPYGQIS